MVAHTPQGAMTATSLVVQVLVATFAVHVVIDTPSGQGGQLWGATD